MTKKKHYSEYWVIGAILFGIAGFALTFTILRLSIIPPEGKIELILSNQTRYTKGSSDGRDTLFLAARQDYFEQLRSDSVISISKVVKDTTTSTSEARDSIEHIKKQGSKYIKDYVFDYLVPKDTTWYNLKDTIARLDKKYEIFESQRKHFLNRNPKLLVWMVSISIAIGFSFYLAPFFFIGILRFKKYLDRKDIITNMIGAILILLLLFSPLLLEPNLYKFTDLDSGSILTYPKNIEPNLKFGIKPFAFSYNFVGTFLCIIFWLVLILSINSTISNQFKKKAKNLQKNILEFQKDFDNYLIIVAIYLAFTIACNSTLVDSMNGLLISNSDNPFFPVELPFMLGSMQTFTLLIIYLAVSSNFSYIKKELSRQSQDKLTHLTKERDVKEYLKIIFAILAPVLGSGVQEILNSILNL